MGSPFSKGSAPDLRPPMRAEDITPEWIEVVRVIVKRDGYAGRMSPHRPVIEFKSLTNNRWDLLGLPNGAVEFVSYEDRNLIFKKIIG